VNILVNIPVSTQVSELPATRGKVWLVGAGPGAPDLLTLRAARLIDAARRHGTVVRLKGGDPMLFGRAQEEIDALAAAGIEVEVVPGITAALAASASLGISLTRRALSRNVVFVTPRIGAGESTSDWIASVAAADTAAIYMGAGEAEVIAAALIARGVSANTPVAVVESASLPGERQHFGRLVDLPELAGRVEGGPALILLGEVLRERVEHAAHIEHAMHIERAGAISPPRRAAA